MSMISFICFVLFIALLFTFLRTSADRVSPGRTFVLVWLFCIGLADLKLSAFQSEWSVYAWVVLLAGVASLLAGILASSVLYLGTPLVPVSKIRQYFSSAIIDHQRFFRVIIILSLFYLLAYFSEVLIEGQIPLFAVRPDRARVEFGVFGLHLIVTTVPITLFLIVEFFALTRKGGRKRIVLAWLGAGLVISFFLLLQRFPLVIFLFMAIPLLYYTGRTLRLRNILLVGGASLAMFLYIQNCYLRMPL